MTFLRRHARSAMASLLLVGVLFIICNLSSASPSGGVAGGSFFHDSDSSSESLKNDHSERNRVYHHDYHDYHHHPYSPPYHDDTNDDHASRGGGGGGGPMILFLFFSFGLFLVGFCKDNNGNSITVLKLQVAMLGGTGNSIQRDLNKTAENADTSSPQGVSHLLTEITLTLQQNPGYCIAGYSSVDLKRSKEDGEKCYNQISLEERAKFDGETLVNLNGNEKLNVKKRKEEGPIFEEEKLLNNGFGKEYIVVTILVAAKGVHKLPSINGAEDLQRALDILRSLVSKDLLAGEVLWTPQKENETLSERELDEDYPQLAESMKSFLVKKKE